MYLKSIEINGFKSFANKIVFKFNDGITAIVGPNGSGKSNVGDAVRWVLGEQSAKQLRGSKMEDIIFAGTEVRKAQSLAYVAITLDNSDHVLPIDYNEVKVARRVFRSGESEYLINGSNCRLKDVQELFLDTGIGKEGYSIIGQGQIDKILSGKPDDRRELFDEAAGIVKFKRRKKTAEKDLEEERLNLSRIKDILAELENQVEPLEKQAAVAKEYLSLRDSLKNYEVNMFLMEYDRIHDSNKSIEEKIKLAKDNLAFKNKEYDNTKDEYHKIENEIEQRDVEIEQLKNKLNEHKLSGQKLEGDIKVMNEQLLSFDVNNKHYKNRMDNIDSDLQEKQNELETSVRIFEENEQRIFELKNEQRMLNDKSSNTSKEVQAYSIKLDELSNELENITKNSLETRTKIERVELQLEQVNIQKVQLNQKLLEQKTIENDLQSDIDVHDEALNEINNTINEISSNNQVALEQLNYVQNEINSNRAVFVKKQQENIREQSRLDSLKNMTERYEGYGNSIKKVMEQKNFVEGIQGVVADIIKVDKRYELAIETALGGSIQNIVTDNEETAKRLIQYLKTNRYGRATFLPLTTVRTRGQFNYEMALSEVGVIGLASKLIQTEDKFRELIESLTGRVLVVDNIDNAIKIARKYNNSIKIVTLEGDLMNPGGSMSGGAYKNTSNLLSRRRELEDIESHIMEDRSELERLNSLINDLQSQKEDLVKTIDTNKSNLQELYLRQNTERMNLKQAKNKFDEAKKFYENITVDTNEIQTKESGLNEDMLVLERRLQDSENIRALKEEEASELRELINNAKNESMKVSSQNAKMSGELAVYEQKQHYMQDSRKRIKGEIEKLSQEKEDILKSLSTANRDMQSKLDEIEQVKQNIESIKQKINTLNDEIEEAVNIREEVNKKHKSFFEKREELNSQISILDKELFRLNNQQEKLKEQLENFVNYMWEEYEMTYSKAVPFRDYDLQSYAQVKKASANIKSKIKSLGDVNVNAVEDYKNILERYELLKNQHDDLVESEKALINIIEDLDVEMRKQFEEKFAYIKKQFDIVFKELFGGGKGTLELIEEEDILDAGIKIIAQPPGKKLQNMMQLSGGEKALTAIALLFAIQNLKPSPFCLLDEIEAALDDANVKRYAEYLNKLTEHTQFIVITHRRGTMAAADILYGITMQEKGVSTLVSVNLIENELDK